MTFKELCYADAIGLEIHVEHYLESAGLFGNLEDSYDEIIDAFYNRAGFWDKHADASGKIQDKLYLDKDDMRIPISSELARFLEHYKYPVDFEVFKLEHATSNLDKESKEKNNDTIGKPKSKSLF